jgi:uncharacterized NAD(P)/FAD-binding protein YdhS
VVGGGFSGAMTAVNIARLCEHPLHLTIVSAQPSVGRGVAYRVRRPEYLLNVAARNMSAFPDEPAHFLQWLRTRSEFESTPEVELRERFVPRHIYGDYLRSIVLRHLPSPSGATPASTEFVIGEAIDIEPREAGCRVHLADGTARYADRVVLATGNEPPAPLPGAASLGDHPAWVGNPWQAWEERLPPPDGTIVILGTGLTAVDAILTLRALGWAGHIHAASRHGWFPHAHFRGIEYPDFPPADLEVATLGLAELVTLVERHCGILRERNANPAIIVDKLRPHTQRIWSEFTREERLRFAKEYAARWNVFRHRIAPDIHAQLISSQLSGQLHVHAGTIEKLKGSVDRILVEFEDGNSLEGDLVINATGPSTKFTATQSPLLQNLLRRGLVAPDETNMGVRIAPDHTVLTCAGERSPWLLALGPMLRGTYWETIAVPELRGQARRVAEAVVGSEQVVQRDGKPHLEYRI